MNNFGKRTLSGLVFVLLIVFSILLSPITFVALFALVAGFAVKEFHGLTNQQKTVEVNVWLASVGATMLFVCSHIAVSHYITFPIYSVYGLYVMLVLLYELYIQKANPIHNWAYFIFGQVLVALPFALLNNILYIDGYQNIILLALFVTIWVNDTGAYLFGITLGKHRLFKRISPKKSWEGFFGGGLTALLSGYVFSLFVPELSLVQWLIFSEIIVVFGTYGDLLESLLKRTLNVKDSGDVIPGHGGLLDRFDSMLLAAPMIYIFLSIVI